MLGARPGVRPAGTDRVVAPAVLDVQHLAPGGQGSPATPGSPPHGRRRRPVHRKQGCPAGPLAGSDAGMSSPNRSAWKELKDRLRPEAQLPRHHPRRFQGQLEAVALGCQLGPLRPRLGDVGRGAGHQRTTLPSSSPAARPFRCTQRTVPQGRPARSSTSSSRQACDADRPDGRQQPPVIGVKAPYEVAVSHVLFGGTRPRPAVRCSCTVSGPEMTSSSQTGMPEASIAISRRLRWRSSSLLAWYWAVRSSSSPKISGPAPGVALGPQGHPGPQRLPVAPAVPPHPAVGARRPIGTAPSSSAAKGGSMEKPA